ncbi:MAG TPA: hemerythrin domain-containing protein [Armatimonadota bacterium]|jgi:hemerythrin-like domain-containing protein
MESTEHISALDRLRADHREVLKRLEEFSAVLEDLPDAPEPGAREALNGLLAFIQLEVWAHFRVEEEALFPLLGGLFPGKDAPVAGGPVYVLTEEHGILRKLVARVASETQRWEAGEPPAADALRLVGRQTVRAFQKHIYKEDNIVFRLAEVSLTPAELAALEEGFERMGHLG